MKMLSYLETLVSGEVCAALGYAEFISSGNKLTQMPGVVALNRKAGTLFQVLVI